MFESERPNPPDSGAPGNGDQAGSPRGRPGSDAVGNRRMLGVAVLAIVMALVALVIVPMLVQRRAAALRTEITVVLDPAEVAARDLELALAREVAILRAYLIEGDAGLLEAYDDYRGRSKAAMDTLRMLLPRLPPDVAAAAHDARGRVERWHAAVDAGRIADTSGVRTATAGDPTYSRPLFEDAFNAVVDLRRAAASARQSDLREMLSTERIGIAATTGLVLLALFSTALVVWLAGRTRLYAEEARNAHEALLRATEARARLLRGFTHDLKNPLSASVLHAQLLEAEVFGPLPERQRRAVDQIGTSIGQAIRLVDDLLELSRAESNLITLTLETIDPGEVVHDVVAAIPAGSRPRIEVQVADPRARIRGDVRRIRQVLDNLVGNAVKYTPPEGMVTVRVTRAGRRPSGLPGAWVTIEVEDNGPGIPTEMHERVFEEFVRLPGTAKTTGGSGIGLTISRQLARAMGGEITLASEVGRGSTFTLWLRVDAAGSD
jgi:signal transduction histidine kinase